MIPYLMKTCITNTKRPLKMKWMRITIPSSTLNVVVFLIRKDSYHTKFDDPKNTGLDVISLNGRPLKKEEPVKEKRTK